MLQDNAVTLNWAEFSLLAASVLVSLIAIFLLFHSRRLTFSLYEHDRMRWLIKTELHRLCREENYLKMIDRMQKGGGLDDAPPPG